MDDLSKLQTQFYRAILAESWGCPTPSLYWDTAGLLMKNQILKKKLLFLHHLATLPEDSLAREVYEVQTRLSLPGLVDECKEMLAEFMVTDIISFTKKQWKLFIKKRIEEKNKYELLEQIKGYKKLCYEELSKESYEVKEYFFKLNVQQVRMKHKLRSRMTPTVRMNFSWDPQFTRGESYGLAPIV